MPDLPLRTRLALGRGASGERPCTLAAQLRTESDSHARYRMRVVAIVQARVGSTRLPGKVLADLCGMTVLARVTSRLMRCETLDGVMVATSTLPADAVVVEKAISYGADVFRGSETDVLARFLGAARSARADVVVRITADCPLIAPGVVDRAVRALEKSDDLVSNAIERTFPRGLECEVFPLDMLVRMERMARSPNAREHVVTFAYLERHDLFVTRFLKDRDDNSGLSWTLDTPEDLAYLRRIYDDCDYRELIERCRVAVS